MNEPKKSKDIPVTQEMLYEMRDELKSDLASQSLEIKSIRGELSSTRENLKGEISGLREEMNSKFDLVLSEIKKIASDVHRTKALVEEQVSRNKYVLDGYDQLHRRQGQFEESIDERVTNIEKVVKSINSPS